MLCYKVNIDTRKIKRSLVDPNTNGNPVFATFRRAQYNKKINHLGIKYNYFANCPSFLSTSFIIESILTTGINYPIGLYWDEGDNRINCHPGMRRLLCWEFLGNTTIDGVIVSDHVEDSTIFNRYERIDLPDESFWKNMKGKYEYLPQDVVDQRSRYPDFILSDFQTRFAKMYSKIESINISSDFTYELYDFYLPIASINQMIDWRTIFTKRRKVKVSLSTNFSSAQVHIVIKKPIKVHPFELLHFLHPNIYCYQDIDRDIIIYNNISEGTETKIIPASYIQKIRG